MTEEQIRNNIKFIQPEDILSIMMNSLSGAIVMRIKRADNNFFLKIMKLEEDSLERLKKIINIYEKGPIRSLEIIECGLMKEYHKYYCIYKWIDGDTLNNLYDEYSEQEYYQFGYQIGQNLRIISEEVPKDACFVRKYDINDMANKKAAEFKKIYQSHLPIFSEIMSEEYANKVINRMLELSNTFYGAEKVYIHGDMHPQNIILNNGELYIIDCETLSIDYFVMNFKWSIGATFDHKENVSFNLGVINGFYNDNPPKNFYNQLMFVLIHKFCDQVREYNDKEDTNLVVTCIKKYKYIFDNIDLSLDDNNFLVNNADIKTE